MKTGLKATLILPGHNRTFNAVLTSTSNALAENSRSALVELQADNADDKLWPGDFAEVHFHIASNPNVMRIPATALVFGPDGLSVATVDDNDEVVSKPVQVGRNLGKDVEVTSGLSAQDKIIDSPLESLTAGEKVQIASAKQDPTLSKNATPTKEANRSEGL
jgi:multidrug efflux pump subunit AcrA (membrane-fusion protein)